jgi:hypothetical protein
VELVITNIEGISATIPSRGYDARGTYLGWELLDEGAFTFQVPNTYIADTDLSLEIHEATAGQSQKHKWQIIVAVNGGSGATYTSEVTSSAVADTLSTRTIDFSTDGEVSSVALAADDTVYVQLKRIAATDTEDSNDIRVYTLTVQITVQPTAESGCSGRLGKIIDAVTFQVNEVLTRSTFITRTQIIDLCDRGNKKIAEMGYWTTNETMSLVSGIYSYDLLTELTYSVQSVEFIQWEDTGRNIHMVATRGELERHRLAIPEGSVIYCAMVDGNQLIVVPTPDANLADALRVYYTYCPADFDCFTAYTPQVPPANDEFYVAWCCKEIFARERGEMPNHQNMYLLWDGRCREELAKLKRQSLTPRFRLRPARW